MSTPIANKRLTLVTARTSIEAAYFESLAATLRTHVASGMKTLVITSGGPGEGKSTVTAGLARAIARTGGMSVVVIDTDRFRPTLHRLFGLENRRGLGELLEDLYHLDIMHETPSQFGIGDWVEILQAQGKTGLLTVTDSGEQYRMVFHKGSITSIQMPQRDEDTRIGQLLVREQRVSNDQLARGLNLQHATQRPLGEVLQGLGYLDAAGLGMTLANQFRESLRRLVSLARPECTFTEMAEAYLPATAGQHTEAPVHALGGEHALDRLADYLKRPFLANQIPSYFKDTEFENLKVLTSGSVPYSLLDARYAQPFQRLLDRLSRIFDVVLIDSPPVAMASPAEKIASIADGVIMVVKADGYDAQVVQQAKAQLDRVSARFVGVVLNQLDMRHADPLLYYYGAYQP
jgi:Mrp family chromosome partitioning ATPase